MVDQEKEILTIVDIHMQILQEDSSVFEYQIKFDKHCETK